MQALRGTTPYEAWTGKKPQVAHFREFGSDVWILNEDKSKSKFDLHANKHIFVRFNDSARLVKYYKSKTHHVLKSWNTKFNNLNEEPIEVPVLDPPRSNPIEDNNNNNAPIMGEEEPENENDSHSLISTPDSPEPESLPTCWMNTCSKQYNYWELNNPNRDIEFPHIGNFIAVMLIIPTSTKLEINVEVQHIMNSMVTGNDLPFDFPQSLKEAKESPEWPEWEKAIQSELNMLCEKGTW